MADPDRNRLMKAQADRKMKRIKESLAKPLLPPSPGRQPVQAQKDAGTQTA